MSPLKRVGAIAGLTVLVTIGPVLTACDETSERKSVGIVTNKTHPPEPTHEG